MALRSACARPPAVRRRSRGVLGELVQVRARQLDPERVPAIGEEVRVRGDLALPERRPQDDFDYPAYLRRNGVHVVLHADEVTPTGNRRGGLRGSSTAAPPRRAGRRRGPAAAGWPRWRAGWCSARTRDRPGHASEDFNRSGLAHVLAVSGQNVTLLAVLAWPLLALAGLGRRGRLLGALALIALYVPLTGAGPSIVRAGAMGAAGMVAALAGRPASRWYSLLLAAAVTHALDPRAWQDAGWQLSFAAVVGHLRRLATAAQAPCVSCPIPSPKARPSRSPRRSRRRR